MKDKLQQNGLRTQYCQIRYANKFFVVILYTKSALLHPTIDKEV